MELGHVFYNPVIFNDKLCGDGSVHKMLHEVLK